MELTFWWPKRFGMTPICWKSGQNRTMSLGSLSSVLSVENIGLLSSPTETEKFGLFPMSMLKTSQMAAETWLTRLLDQPVLESNEIAKWVGEP